MINYSTILICSIESGSVLYKQIMIIIEIVYYPVFTAEERNELHCRLYFISPSLYLSSFLLPLFVRTMSV